MPVTEDYMSAMIDPPKEMFQPTEEYKQQHLWPRVGICIVIRKEGRVLIHKRKGKHAGGTWAFPGGHLEKWETWEGCALREMKEEAGDLEVSPPKFWTARNTMFRDEGRHYVVICMVSDWIAGEAEVMEPTKCECWEWHPWDDLPSPLMQGLQKLKDDGMDPFQV
jgi:8-oxo-dGTP diphosphatase